MSKKSLIIGLLIVSTGNLYAIFSSLDDAQKYASHVIENPSSDDNDWLNADYSTYHATLKPSFLDRMLYSIFPSFSKQKYAFNEHYFLSVLDALIIQRTSKRLNGDNISALKIASDKKIILWGDIRGAFHSLVRDLEYLLQQGIIDNNLQVIKKDYYLVFNGETVGPSPYALETLQLLMLLLLKNPENVLYLRGHMEQKRFWVNYNLGREVRVRLGGTYEHTLSIYNKIDDFFSTLPIAFYIFPNSTPVQLIRISPFGNTEVKFNEPQLGSFWQEMKIESLSHITYNAKKTFDSGVALLSVFKNEYNTLISRAVFGEPKDITGLGRLNQDAGVPAWGVLSSPLPVYKKYYGFYYDAFAELHINARDLAKSTIIFHSQDTRLMNGFTTHRSLNMVTATINKSDKDPVPISFGLTLPLIGGTPILAKMVEQGLFTSLINSNLYGDFLNAWIRVKDLNDDYVGYKVRKNVQSFLNEGIDTLLFSVGGRSLVALSDLIKEDKILSLFPITGDIFSRLPENKGIIYLRASYVQEMEAMIEYLVTEKSVRKFAFFYELAEGGVTTLLAAQQALKNKGITEWIDVSYTPGSTDFKKQADTLREAQVDAIGFFAGAKPAQRIINLIGVDHCVNKILFASSFAREPSLIKYLERVGLNVIFGAVVPNPATSNMPIVKQYRSMMDRFVYPYDVFSLEVYLGVNLLFDILKKMKLPITRGSLKKELEGLKNYEFGGLTFTFDPEMRSFIMPVWLDIDPGVEWPRFDNIEKAKVLLNQEILKPEIDKHRSSENTQKVLPKSISK